MSTHSQEAVARSANDAEDRHPAVQSRGMLSRPDVKDMWKYTLLGALAAGAALLVYQNLPDLIRYLKIRSM